MTEAAIVLLFDHQLHLEGQPEKKLREIGLLVIFLPLLHELGLYGNPPAPASVHKCPQPSSLLTIMSETIGY